MTRKLYKKIFVSCFAERQSILFDQLSHEKTHREIIVLASFVFLVSFEGPDYRFTYFTDNKVHLFIASIKKKIPVNRTHTELTLIKIETPCKQ